MSIAVAICHVDAFDNSLEGNVDEVLQVLSTEEDFLLFASWWISNQEELILDSSLWKEFQPLAEGMKLDVPAMKAFVKGLLRLHNDGEFYSDTDSDTD